MELTVLFSLVSLFALVIALVDAVSKRRAVNDDLDLDTVAKYIYDLDDPDVLKELSILTDVRRLLIHLELTEGRVRLG